MVFFFQLNLLRNLWCRGGKASTCSSVKGAVRSFGSDILIEREKRSSLTLFFKVQNKLNKQTPPFFHDRITRRKKLSLNDNTVSFYFVYTYVADPATFVAMHSVSFDNSLHIQLWKKKKYFWGCTITSLIFWFWYWISSAELHTAPLKPFSNERKTDSSPTETVLQHSYQKTDTVL